MADVFVSYARKNQPSVAEVSGALEASGYSLWWDRQIETGADYGMLIEREIEAAGCVLVAWSTAARQSLWVRAEANEALDAGKLVQICLDGTKLPLPFTMLHFLDFSGWRGERDCEPWTGLDARVSAMLRGEPVEAAPAEGERAQPRGPALQGLGRVAWLGWAAIALAAAMAVAILMAAGGTLSPTAFGGAALFGLATAALLLVLAAFTLVRVAGGVATMSERSSPTTRRFVRAAWLLIALQLVAAAGAMGLAVWAATEVQRVIDERDALALRMREIEAQRSVPAPPPPPEPEIVDAAEPVPEPEPEPVAEPAPAPAPPPVARPRPRPSPPPPVVRPRPRPPVIRPRPSPPIVERPPVMPPEGVVDKPIPEYDPPRTDPRPRPRPRPPVIRPDRPVYDPPVTRPPRPRPPTTRDPGSRPPSTRPPVDQPQNTRPPATNIPPRTQRPTVSVPVDRPQTVADPDATRDSARERRRRRLPEPNQPRPQ